MMTVSLHSTALPAIIAMPTAKGDDARTKPLKGGLAR